MKEFNILSITCAALGGIFAAIFGRVDNLFIMLLTFMAIDYITGVLLAAVWKKSPKTETGALNSSVGFKGICKKVANLILLIIAVMLDKVIGDSNLVFRTATIFALSANELVSILENIGGMGVKIPAVLVNAIDILNKKGEEKDE